MTVQNLHERPKAVLFDLDGTLLDTYQLILTSMNYTMQVVLGKEFPPELIMKKVGQPLAVQLLDFAHSSEQRDEMLELYREHNASLHDEMVQPFKGVEETLKILQERGFLLGIVTSKRHALALRGLQLFALDGYFRFLIGADDCSSYKPEPGPILYGAELLGLDPRFCVYVGDSPYDIQAGNAAGSTTIAALWGMFGKEELLAEHPDHSCKYITDLPDLLFTL